MLEEQPKKVKRGAPRGVPRKRASQDQTNENNPNITEHNPDAMENNENFLNDVGNEKPPIQDAEFEVVSSGATQDNQSQTPPPSTEQADVSAAPFYDPLIAENVETKTYEKGLGSDSIPAGDIPEPIFKRPSVIVDDTPPKQTTQIPKAEIIPPLNEEISGMSDAEKKAGAEMTVAAFWSGYEKLNLLMGNMLQIPVDRRLKMQSEGQLDLNMEVTVTVGGDRVTVNEFFEQYNADVKAAFVVDDKLKADLDAPMKREAMKRGLIMSDMQTIIYRLGEDMVSKTVQMISIRSAVKNFEKAVIGEFQRMKLDLELEKERVMRESRMIDPLSEEGQKYFYDMYRRIRDSEMSEQEKAKATSDLFKSEHVEAPAQQETKSTATKVQEPTISEAEIIEESNDLDIKKEL